MNNNSTPTLTIVTPTYNRSQMLRACWKSLKDQTNNDFQWLVIDDGSEDNTRQVIEKFMAEAPNMCIDYYFKENGGKHTALNFSHKYIKGKYVLILDSDDMLTPDAVEIVISSWRKYDYDTSVNVIYFYRKNKNGETLFNVKNTNSVIYTYKEKRISKLHSRDCCDTFRSETFIKFVFPVFSNERFIGEGAAFLEIELLGKGVYIDRAIYVCDYLENGLTKQGRKMRLSNPCGGRFNSNVYMNRKLSFSTRIKNAVLYVCYSHFAGASIRRMYLETDYRGIMTVCLIPGTLLYFYWKRRYFSNANG